MYLECLFYRLYSSLDIETSVQSFVTRVHLAVVDVIFHFTCGLYK